MRILTPIYLEQADVPVLKAQRLVFSDRSRHWFVHLDRSGVVPVYAPSLFVVGKSSDTPIAAVDVVMPSGWKARWDAIRVRTIYLVVCHVEFWLGYAKYWDDLYPGGCPERWTWESRTPT